MERPTLAASTLNIPRQRIAEPGLESPMPMQGFCIALFLASIASFYCPTALAAKTVTVRADWRETRTMLAQPGFRPNLRIHLKSNKKTKGALCGTTAAGLTLERNGAEILIERTEISSIRLVPRKASGNRNRVLALVGGIPAGLAAALGAWHVGCAVAGGCGEPADPVASAGFYAVMVAVPAMLYRLATGADRRVLLIILDESAAKSTLPDP